MFRFKDLTIDVARYAQPCHIFHSVVPCRFYCSFHITDPCRFTCTVIHSEVTCQFGTQIPTVTCPGSLVTDTLGTETILENPGALKQRLKQALAAAEASEKVQVESEQPGTLEEINLLEQKMTEALEELRRQKAELQKKGK